MKLPESLLRFIYFLFGFFLCLLCCILFLRYSGLLRFTTYDLRSTPFRTGLLRPETPFPRFPDSSFPRFFDSSVPQVPVSPSWFFYADSQIHIRVRALAADTISYRLFAPVLSTSSVPSQNFSIIFSVTTLPSAHLLFGYKNFLFHLQYSPDLRSTPYALRLSYGLGYHFRF